jgi:hypothetical protein
MMDKNHPQLSISVSMMDEVNEDEGQEAGGKMKYE